MEKRVVATIVTHNRKDLLLECIAAIRRQVGGTGADILVVDNASTDGTGEAVEALYGDEVFYLNTGANLGGAGGFNLGMRWACENGYDYCWVMDDDCIPLDNALEALVDADRRLGESGAEYGFLSSRILWKDGSLCRMNIQRETMYRPVRDWNRSLIPVTMASFVSMWIPTEIIRKLGLPIREFFIWTDDWEFSRRISRSCSCYLVNDSVCTHLCRSNQGADISSSPEEGLERFRYLYRNDVYLYRREGVRGFMYQVLRLSLHMLRILTGGMPGRRKRMRIVAGATISGFSFRPEIEYPRTGGSI